MAEILGWTLSAVNAVTWVLLFRAMRRYRRRSEECDGLRIALQSCIREVSLNALELQLAQGRFRSMQRGQAQGMRLH